jgi:hypothetical protein
MMMSKAGRAGAWGSGLVVLRDFDDDDGGDQGAIDASVRAKRDGLAGPQDQPPATIEIHGELAVSVAAEGMKAAGHAAKLLQGWRSKDGRHAIAELLDARVSVGTAEASLVAEQRLKSSALILHLHEQSLPTFT